MADPTSAYYRAFQARLKAARKSKGYRQREMATFLGVELDAYKKYENRPGSSLPLHLLPLVCELLDIDPWFLLTGSHSPRPVRERSRVRPFGRAG